MRLSSFVRSGILAALALFLASGAVLAQSATTGAAAGVITGDDGAPVSGASVTFTYLPTGFTTAAITNVRGAYRLQGLEPGSPYRVEVSSLGYRSLVREDVAISLGQTYRLTVSLEATAVQLEALVVETDALASQFSGSTQGTSTTINQQQLEALPALDRRFENLARLTPQIVATDANGGLGLSVVGQNNRYNTVQIDGATVNDRFGLGATGAAGGQARGKPIGYDAVKEFQVLLSPYDVRQGSFTGALINAVTKSGGNEFFGSAFGLYRNQDLAGDPLGQNEFKNWQFGGSLGGPIIRDQAFFFANVELQRASQPASGPYIGAPESVSGIQPRQADIDAVNAALTTYGLQTGDGNSVTNDNPLANVTLRGDLNIDDNNRAVVRYSYNRAEDDVFSRTTSTNNPAFQFFNSGYQFVSKAHNPSVQLFSNFAGGATNEFRISYNRIRDARDPNAAEPNVTIEGFMNGADEYGFQTGAEQFSQGNRLDQDIWELTDNYTFAPMGDHTFTVGARAEFYSVSNLFAQSSFGVYTFDSLAAFQDGGIGSASGYTISGALSGGPVQSADFNAGQYSVYAQDQFQVSETFSLTGGVRVDIPVFNDQPVYADQVNIDFNDPEVPSGQFMLNPRVGFNWDIESEMDQQLRGGVGLFTGNPAYVWMSNAYANNGTGLGILSCGESNPNGLAPAFSSDPDNQTLSCAPGTADGGGTVGIGDGSFLGEVDLVNRGTQFPQVFRANLAYDRRLPKDFLLTVEGIYNKGVNDYFIVNRNLQTIAGMGVGGRVMYGTIGSDGRSDPVYFRPDVYGTGSTGVFDLINTASNYSYNLTLGLQKFVGDDIRLTGAYTYSHSEDVQSFTSSRATSNWRFGRVNAGNQLLDPATTSSFDRPHKLTMSGSYTLPFSEEFPTEISAIYIGYSGTPYTYISGGSSGRGDLNADGIVGNDPLYIPTGIGDPNLTFDTMEDAVAFDALINSLDCVNEQRGQIMERNSCRNPWQNFLDLSVKQGFPQFAGGNRFSLQLGVYNFLNLLNEDWGQIETAGGGVFDTQTLLRVEDPDGRATFENFSYSGPDIMEEGTDALYDNNGDPRNSWQLQVQLRYEF